MERKHVTPKDIARMAGLTITRINQLRKTDPTFPQPTNPGDTRPRWRNTDIVEWLKRSGRKPEDKIIRTALEEWDLARDWGHTSTLTATDPGPMLTYTNDTGDTVCVDYRTHGGTAPFASFCRKHRATWAITVSPQLSAENSHLCSIAHSFTNYEHTVIRDVTLSYVAQYLSLDLAYYFPGTPEEPILAAPQSVIRFPSTCAPSIATDLALAVALPENMRAVVLYDLAQSVMMNDEPESRSHMFNPFPEPCVEDREVADAVAGCWTLEPITDASIYHLLSLIHI